MIIDEQGRLFGKVNIIDFLVAVFLLSCLPAFYYGWKIFVEPHKIQKTTVTLSLKEHEELKAKIRDYEVLIAEKNKLQKKVDKFLEEHKLARRYFKDRNPKFKANSSL